MKKNIELTIRAWEMLWKTPRDLTGQPRTQAEVEAILKEENFPLDHPIIPFQLTLAGYQMTGYGIKLLLGFTPNLQIYNRYGHWFCQIAENIFPPSSPEAVLMDEKGVIYCDTSETPLASTIEILIESKALEEDMEILLGTTLYSVGGPGQLEISFEDIAKINQRLIPLGLKEVKEASDDYEHWWVSSNCYVHVFRNWYTDERPIIIMTNDLDRLRELGAVLAGVFDFPSYYYSKKANNYYTGKIEENEPKLIEWHGSFNPDNVPFYSITTKLSNNKILRNIIHRTNS